MAATTYQEITVAAKFSSSSSLEPHTPFKPDAHNPGAGAYKYVTSEVNAPTAGVLIDLVQFAAVTNVIIKNMDATNYVQVTFRTTGGGANDQVLRIPAGAIVMLGSAITIASDLTLTANTAACMCLVCIIGSAP